MRDSWTEVTLGELTASTRPICYGVLKPGPYVQNGVPLVRITDMDQPELGPAGMHRISADLDHEFRRSRLSGNEVLLSIQGTVGKVSRCGASLVGGNISRTIALIDCDSRLINNYLAYYLEWLSANGKFNSSGSTRDSLNISEIRIIAVPVPPLSEQKRIVDVMASVDIYIAALQQQADDARTARNAVLQGLLTAGGDGWTETTLGEIAEYINGYPFKPEELGEEGTPVIRIKQLLDPAEACDKTLIQAPDRCVLQSGDIVFSWSGTLAVRVWGRERAYLNQHLFRVVEKEGVLREWLPLLLDHSIRDLSEMTHGTTMKHVTKQTLLPHRVQLPPLSEQKRIVGIVSALDDVVITTERAVADAQSLRTGLTSDLLTGGHEIPESYDRLLGAA